MVVMATVRRWRTVTRRGTTVHVHEPLRAYLKLMSAQGCAAISLRAQHRQDSIPWFNSAWQQVEEESFLRSRYEYHDEHVSPEWFSLERYLHDWVDVINFSSNDAPCFLTVMPSSLLVFSKPKFPFSRATFPSGTTLKNYRQQKSGGSRNTMRYGCLLKTYAQQLPQKI